MRGEALHVGALFVMWNFRTCSDGSLLALSHSIEQPGSKPEHTRASHSHLERRASHTRDCLLEFEKACGSCLAKPCSASVFMLWKGIMPETMEISDAAKSGDGTTTNVGIKMTGTFQCPECRQKFDSEKAKQLRWKFIHDPNRHQED
eukprot:s3931_g3.t1